MISHKQKLLHIIKNKGVCAGHTWTCTHCPVKHKATCKPESNLKDCLSQYNEKKYNQKDLFDILL